LWLCGALRGAVGDEGSALLSHCVEEVGELFDVFTWDDVDLVGEEVEDVGVGSDAVSGEKDSCDSVALGGVVEKGVESVTWFDSAREGQFAPKDGV